MIRLKYTTRRGHVFLTRTDEDLVVQVQKAKARGFSEIFWITRRGRHFRVERKSDSDLYQRMMAAKGIQVRLGATA